MRFFNRPTDDERNLSLLEHLDELRARLIYSVIAIAIGFMIGYAVSGWTVDFLLRPIQESGLVPQNQIAADFIVSEDGSLHIRGIEPLRRHKQGDQNPDAVPADRPTSELLSLDPTEGTNIARMRFYAEGGSEPLAIFESFSPTGVAYIRPMDPFLIRIKASLILGILLALPVLLYQIYAFVSPGLFPHERRAIIPMLGAALFLFPIGAAFAYYLLKFALFFFARYAADQAYMFNDIRAYMSLALTSMLVFGVLFELPIVVLLLTRLGIVSTDTLAAKRKPLFVLLLVVCAIATPTGDPLTLAAMALPLYGLFELSLIIGRITERRVREREEAASDDT